MRSFRFDELWLLSERTSAARRIIWGKGKNALVGGNHTGKSTALRMIYETFGCKTRPLGSEWDSGVVSVVCFSLDSTQYQMLRRGSMLALFQGEGRLVWAVGSAGESRDQFSSLLDFVLPLTNQQGESRQARPAFYFLPFFIDQDGGWNSAWQTFQGLGEFRDWQRPTIELALGIRSSAYWQKQAEIAAAKKAAAEMDAQQRAFVGARQRLEAQLPNVPWFKDALRFRTELKELEKRAGHLAEQQDKLRAMCTELAAERDALKAQILLVDDALKAHAADMRFLDLRHVGEPLICPTCGAEHEHSFSTRLNLEAEADELQGVRVLLSQKLSRVERELEVQNEKVKDVERKCAEIEEILGRTRGDLTLRGLLNKVGVERAYSTFEEQIKTISSARACQELVKRDLESELKVLNDPLRVKAIKEKFDRLYYGFASDLSVPPSMEHRVGEVQSRPRQGGSGGPRAILAYYYSIAHVASEFSPGYLPPLVIDSPHANAQDEINRPKVTEFIFKNIVEGQQLIVGLEDPPPPTVSLDGPDDIRHDLDAKFGLLRKSEYLSVLALVEPLVRIAVASLRETLF